MKEIFGAAVSAVSAATSAASSSHNIAITTTNISSSHSNLIRETFVLFYYVCCQSNKGAGDFLLALSTLKLILLKFSGLWGLKKPKTQCKGYICSVWQ